MPRAVTRFAEPVIRNRPGHRSASTDCLIASIKAGALNFDADCRVESANRPYGIGEGGSESVGIIERDVTPFRL